MSFFVEVCLLKNTAGSGKQKEAQRESTGETSHELKMKEEEDNRGSFTIWKQPSKPTSSENLLILQLNTKMKKNYLYMNAKLILVRRWYLSWPTQHIGFFLLQVLSMSVWAKADPLLWPTTLKCHITFTKNNLFQWRWTDRQITPHTLFNSHRHTGTSPVFLFP